MSNPSKPDPKDLLSPLSTSAVRRPRSPSPSPVADDDDVNPSEKKTSKRHSFYKAMKFMHRSNSSEAEDATQGGKLTDGKRKTWKVKISSHSAPPEYEERYIRTREVCAHPDTEFYAFLLIPQTARQRRRPKDPRVWDRRCT